MFGGEVKARREADPHRERQQRRLQPADERQRQRRHVLGRLGRPIFYPFDSLAEAEAYARSDPFVTAGYETFQVRPWEQAHRGNGYLDPDASPG